MLDTILDVCSKMNVKPLYVCKVGSYLYGTSIEDSDTNYMVLYLPNKIDML